MRSEIIIVGAGHAGYQLSRTIRQRDATIPITLITEDRGELYSKPLLSRAFTEKKTVKDLVIQTADLFSNQLNINILTETTVQKLDRFSQQITVKTKHKKYGNKYKYKQLILATGAAPIKPYFAINSLAHTVYTINHLHDYIKFRTALENINQKKITIIGTGLVGCELANDLCNGGYEVTMVSLDCWPLARLLPKHVGLILQQALMQQGVSFKLERVIENIVEHESGWTIQTQQDHISSTGMIVVAIGLTVHSASYQWIKEAGITLGSRGIVTNNYLQTNDSNIFALGDCAEVEGLFLPYIAPINRGAVALAETLTSKQLTAVHYPAMAITVKTPAYPLVIALPQNFPLINFERYQYSCEQIYGEDDSIEIQYFNPTKTLVGFILGGKKIAERKTLETALEAWL